MRSISLIWAILLAIFSAGEGMASNVEHFACYLSGSSTACFEPVNTASGGTNQTTWTAGSIPFLSSATQFGQDNSELFWNDTTHSMGIGTASPNYNLEVDGANYVTLGVHAPANPLQTFFNNTETVGNIGSGNIDGTAGNNDFGLQTNQKLWMQQGSSVPQFVITSGKTAISDNGFASPAFPLHVYGNQTAAMGIDGPTNPIVALDIASVQYGTFGSAAGLVTGGAATDLGFQSDNNIDFVSGGTTNIAMKILSSGAVTVNDTLTDNQTFAINNGTATASITNLSAASNYNFNLPATAGTTGQYLTSAGGGGTAMTWSAPSSGTVSSITAGTGLTGGTITTTGTIALSTPVSIANGGTNSTTAAAAFEALNPTTLQGDIIWNNGVGPTRLGVGSNGQVLTVTSGSNIGWVTPSAGTGTVTSVAETVPAFLSISGSPITTSGTLAIGLSGTALPVANGGTGVTTSTGSTNVVLSNSPTLTTPLITTNGSIDVTGAGTLAIGASTGANTITVGSTTGNVKVANTLQVQGSSGIYSSVEHNIASGGTWVIATVSGSNTGGFIIVTNLNTGENAMFLFSTGSGTNAAQLVSQSSGWAVGTGTGANNKLQFASGDITVTNNEGSTMTYGLTYLQNI